MEVDAVYGMIPNEIYCCNCGGFLRMGYGASFESHDHLEECVRMLLRRIKVLEEKAKRKSRRLEAVR